MPKPIPYDTSEDALLRPAKNAVFFDGWETKDYGNHDLLCAEMSRLAYARREVVREALSRARFALTAFIGGESLAERADTKGTQAFVATSQEQGLTVLAFRGTESNSPEDLVTDLLTGLRPWPQGGRIHKGFADRYLKVRETVAQALVHREKTLLVTGHSLGAALATVAATDVKPDWLINFGSPRVGDTTFCKLVDEKKVRRFVDCCDMVARVPPIRFTKPILLKLLEEVGDFARHGEPIAGAAHVALTAVASLIELGFALDRTIEFSHVSSPIYIRADGTRVEQISDAELAADQQKARDGYPSLVPRLRPALPSLPSLLGANPGKAFAAFIKTVIGSADSRQVPRRDLADHAPINYLSSFTGRA